MNKIKYLDSLDPTNQFMDKPEEYGKYILERINKINPVGYKQIQKLKKGMIIWIDLWAVSTPTFDVFLENPHRRCVDRFEVS